MKICVAGLWHLGSVIAACLAEKKNYVTGLDSSAEIVQKLKTGKSPVFEPGLDQLLRRGIKNGYLKFTTSLSEGLQDADVIWVAYDTPITETDEADVSQIKTHILSLFPYLKNRCTVIISSQVPVGFCRMIEDQFHHDYSQKKINFFYSPENLRLGKALDAFQKPDRIVIGSRNDKDRRIIERFFKKLSPNLEWMSVESAEMTKHGINAFLATSVSFINELAVLCESTGADAREVEKGLKSDSRIGPMAYLKPGSSFAGGTLARDVRFLTQKSEMVDEPSHLLNSILKSNLHHQDWSKRKLLDHFKVIRGHTISILGLTYKSETDTLRRSWTIDLCRWLKKENAHIQAYDPHIDCLPADLQSVLTLQTNILDAITNSDAIIIGSDKPSFRELSAGDFKHLRQCLVIDPNGFLSKNYALSTESIKYCAVGFTLNKELFHP